MQDLHKTKEKLQEIFDTIPLLRNEFQPLPILDVHNAVPVEASYNTITGLNAFRESVRHDICAIDKHIAAHKTSISGVRGDILPPPVNAPYIIAVWNEIIKASAPLLAIGRMFLVKSATAQRVKASRKSKSVGRPEEVKVDVVADNGRSWIRVNTIKNSRLLAEFREFDSYCTDSDSDPEGEGDIPPVQTLDDNSSNAVLENSVMKMGRALMEAASLHTVVDRSTGLTVHPKVTLHLTRLTLRVTSLKVLRDEGLILPSLHTLHGEVEDDVLLDKTQEDRITKIIRELMGMGLEVVLGEYVDNSSSDTQPSTRDAAILGSVVLSPTRNINLDLSVLVALVSDITHAPLPTDQKDAVDRFIAVQQEQARIDERRRVQKELAMVRKAIRDVQKQGNTRGNARHEKTDQRRDGDFNLTDSTFGSKSLRHDKSTSTSHPRALASQAMQERRSGLFDEIVEQLQKTTNNDYESQFWTTPDVRDRFLRIVSIIGGPKEKKRAEALFFNLNDSPCVESSPEALKDVNEAKRVFWEETRHVDRRANVVPVHVLDDCEAYPVAEVNDDPKDFWLAMLRTCRRLLADQPVPHPRSLLDVSLPETHGAAPSSDMERASVTKTNSRLTAHTVASFLHGASRRSTTLTANRASVRELLKEMSADGWVPKARGLRVGEHVINQQHDDSVDGPQGTDEAVAIWVVEPRSLAEGMRSDFQA
ncbi:hypothetical protein SCHPADRAFT_998068 [Schizopora paradoxa]|uniref:DUF1308 domain-containing protein n=1 Tax=Schizopora paradoxa TaxID=27342 RepID=A0A0H2RLP1_9AGAM|nr:hypothetical protein SCHPADRAFT_998068 [Schizopora paradoxa]